MRNVFGYGVALAVICLAQPAMAQVQPISVPDFLLDRTSYQKGASVTVAGHVACMSNNMGELCYLYGDNIAQSVTFDASHLSRADRKQLLGCAMIVSPCEAAVSFKIPTDAMTFAYPATALYWPK